MNIDCIADLTPDNINHRKWMKTITLQQIDEWALKHSIKVPLTEAQDFDVMIFKSIKFQRPIHFGMFLKPCNILHLE